ncbi:MAG: hypothetical protein EP332_11125 [Bacteroidetes bacterium]|nr:MAG: hypothetical protein EP332_11125 [Bacteroidota bacterium]
MWKSYFIAFALCGVFIASCSTAKVQTNAQTRALAQKHTKIAILPTGIHLTYSRGVSPVYDKQELESLSKRISLELYWQLLEKIAKSNSSLLVQNTEQTSAVYAKLMKTDSFYSPQELCKRFGVDAIIKLEVFSDQLMSSRDISRMDSTALRKAVVESTTYYASLFEPSREAAIWTYKGEYARGYAATPGNTFASISYDLVKKLPYW